MEKARTAPSLPWVKTASTAPLCRDLREELEFVQTRDFLKRLTPEGLEDCPGDFFRQEEGRGAHLERVGEVEVPRLHVRNQLISAKSIL